VSLLSLLNGWNLMSPPANSVTLVLELFQWQTLVKILMVSQSPAATSSSNDFLYLTGSQFVSIPISSRNYLSDLLLCSVYLHRRH
jgi:hypothetical protein